jgi:hypothetical protein
MHDTFSGSSVDLAHWAVYQKHGHERWGLRHPSALSVADGMLTITARNDPAHPYWRRARELWGTIVGEIVSGGMAHRVPVQFGRWEARVRVDGDPTGATSGLVLTWPSAGGVWPVDGENNVWETGGNPTRTPVFAFHHYDVTNKQFSRRLDIDGRQWHTVALERLPGGTLRHTIDGRASYEIRSPLIPEHPHQLTLQLDALAARTGEPVRMQVDEVRVARCDA